MQKRTINDLMLKCPPLMEDKSVLRNWTDWKLSGVLQHLGGGKQQQQQLTDMNSPFLGGVAHVS